MLQQAREPTSEEDERTESRRKQKVKRSLTALLRLVGAVAAVVVVVAHEVFGNALAVLAHELAAGASVVEH